MIRKTSIIAVIATLVVGTVSAQPSVYYKWQNSSTKVVKCEPDSPGKDWVRMSGPYSDPDCKFLEPK